MSSYIHFYLRVGDNFVPLGSFSRSSRIYRMFQSVAPYEQIAAFTAAQVSEIQKEAGLALKQINDSLTGYKKMKQDIMAANNSLEEKMEYISSYIDSCVADALEDKEELEYAVHYLSFILEAIWETEFNNNGFDGKNFFYAGIEISNPTIKDIVEDPQ